LTGWPQVNGRNALEWDEKLELDAWYADHCGFWLDLKILLLTPGKILRRQGVSAPGHATTPYFQGSDKRDAA
jgi:lipopolysaccharide/colanic/teichoic acid biosynthesis glycosyltransferase